MTTLVRPIITGNRVVDQFSREVSDALSKLATSIGSSSGTAGGDATGTLSNLTIIRIYQRALANIAPSAGQVLTWDAVNSWWYPAASGTTVTLAGDVTGLSSANTVVKFQGYPVSVTAPATRQAMVSDGTQWAPRTIEQLVAATVAALKAINHATLLEGHAARVSTFPRRFIWNSTSTLTADNLTVITPTSVGVGAGRWIWDGMADPANATQTDWYVDPSAGSDEAAGTVGAPLATWRELHRRLKGLYLAQDTNFWVVTSAAVTDAITLDVYAANVKLAIRGVRTVTRTGTFTSTAAPNAAANTCHTVTDTGVVSWTADANNILTVTSGTDLNRVCWVESDLGSNTARVTVPSKIALSSATWSFNNISKTALANGATYSISSLPTAYLGAISVKANAGNATTTTRVFVDGIRIGYSQFGSPSRLSGFAFVFYECRIDSSQLLDWGDCSNCYFPAGFLCRTNRMQVQGGMSRGAVQVEAAAPQFIDFLSFAGQFSVQMGSVIAAGLGVFNVTGDAIVVQRGACLNSNSAFGGAIYGSGSTGAGLHLHSGSMMLWQPSATVYSVTGTAGNVKIEGSTTSSFLNPADGSYIPARSLTWTNLAASIASGGFGGQFVDLSSGAQFRYDSSVALGNSTVGPPASDADTEALYQTTEDASATTWVNHGTRSGLVMPTLTQALANGTALAGYLPGSASFIRNAAYPSYTNFNQEQGPRGTAASAPTTSTAWTFQVAFRPFQTTSIASGATRIIDGVRRTTGALTSPIAPADWAYVFFTNGSPSAGVTDWGVAFTVSGVPTSIKETTSTWGGGYYLINGVVQLLTLIVYQNAGVTAYQVYYNDINIRGATAVGSMQTVNFIASREKVFMAGYNALQSAIGGACWSRMVARQLTQAEITDTYRRLA